MGSNALVGALMIVAGCLLASGGVVVLTWRQPALGDPEAPLATEPITALNSSSPPAPEGGPLTPEEKGKAFEEWVVKRFNPEYFNINEWRSDKFVDGIYPQSSVNPDLEVEFRLKAIHARFAVECKWRRSFGQGDRPGIEWASERQIANYEEFSKARNMPVFVVIGIGGEPDDPASLYVVDLTKLKYPWVAAEYLAKFRRGEGRNEFFYDYKTLELK